MAEIYDRQAPSRQIDGKREHRQVVDAYDLFVLSGKSRRREMDDPRGVVARGASHRQSTW
jgi:hypothetical protein